MPGRPEEGPGDADSRLVSGRKLKTTDFARSTFAEDKTDLSGDGAAAMLSELSSVAGLAIIRHLG